MTEWLPLLDAIGKAVAMATPAALALWRIGIALKRRVADPMAAFVQRVDTTVAQVDHIYAQVGVNGGTSLRDKVDQIDTRTRQDSARLLALRLAQPEPMFEACDEGQFVVVNRALEHLAGRSAADLQGMGWVNAIHHDDRDRVLKEWGFAISDGRAFLESCRLLRGDGRVVLVRIEARPMPDATHPDVVVGWHGIVDVEVAA